MKFRDDDFKKSADEEEMMMRVHDIDLYDQALLDLKKLVNERNAAPQNRQRPYAIAIDKSINEIYELAQGDMPTSAIKHDISMALQGGKYRKLYQDPTSDVIEIDRKKKSSKAKPKRKPVKKVVKKKIIKKNGGGVRK